MVKVKGFIPRKSKSANNISSRHMKRVAKRIVRKRSTVLKRLAEYDKRASVN